MNNEKGVALILALFTMLFLSLIVVAFLDALTIDQQITTNDIRTLEATYIADAGVEMAVYELRQDETYAGTGGDVEFPAGSGNTYNVTVDPALASQGIVSIGMVGGFSKTIQVGYLIDIRSPYNRVKLDTWE